MPSRRYFTVNTQWQPTRHYPYRREIDSHVSLSCKPVISSIIACLQQGTYNVSDTELETKAAVIDSSRTQRRRQMITENKLSNRMGGTGSLTLTKCNRKGIKMDRGSQSKRNMVNKGVTKRSRRRWNKELSNGRLLPANINQLWLLRLTKRPRGAKHEWNTGRKILTMVRMRWRRRKVG